MLTALRPIPSHFRQVLGVTMRKLFLGCVPAVLLALSVSMSVTACGEVPAGDGDAENELDAKFQTGGSVYLTTFERTMYVLAFEGDFSGEKVSAHDGAGEEIGRLSVDFLNDVVLQGSGLTQELDVITIEWMGCAGGTFASVWGTQTCFRVLDPDVFPYGVTAVGSSPVPFRSVAVAPGQVSLGTRLYLPAWDGRKLPNGKTHDGCFEATDTGQAIVWNHVDVHAGAGRNIYNQLAAGIGGVDYEDAYVGEAKCAGDLSSYYDQGEFLRTYPGFGHFGGGDKGFPFGLCGMAHARASVNFMFLSLLLVLAYARRVVQAA